VEAAGGVQFPQAGSYSRDRAVDQAGQMKFKTFFRR
jgi:hypothetical protein